MNRPLRRCVTLMLLAGGLAATPAQAATRTCSTLKGRTVIRTGALLVVGVPLDVVSKRNATHVVGRTFLACVRPAGAVRKVGAIYRTYTTTGPVKGETAVESGLTSFGASAGSFLVTRTRESNLTGDYEERTYRVVDVATGRRYTYFHFLLGNADSAEPAPPAATRLDAKGRLAAILSQPEDEDFSAPPVGSTQVVVFSAAGRRTILDEAPVAAIPKSSLTFSGGIVGWRNAGVAKTAPAP
jgi:hypothetical protein